MSLVLANYGELSQLNEPRLWTNLEGLSEQWIQEIVYVGDSDDLDDDAYEDDDSVEGETLWAETDLASFDSSLPPWE
ncbi:hypothetical protein PLEOSDRAFT_152159 [Pleurotus ostreatus PC15]|uniref:Uncharacterized protein n=1 Tax=Pleurotus ostreatus (strain PC15) TaxID=1137138 RepID=A0A067PEC3_PLEO1|nr:hypothetical protein PLEOSDRAFT_152159 [Pleurotus ostreatus PC15]